MSETIELVKIGYQEIGQAYGRAVEVQKFVWTTYHALNIALVGGAGYLIFKCNARVGWAIVLLVFGVALSLMVREQLQRGQTVIHRAMAAGLLMEWDHPEIGSLYGLSISHGDWRHFEDLKKEYLTQRSTQHDAPPLVTEDFGKLGIQGGGGFICWLYAGTFTFCALILTIKPEWLKCQ